MSEMTTTIFGGLFTLLGVIIGWGLNELSTVLRSKPKLSFQMVGTPDAELVENELRTKTSLSEYGIEVFNIGQKPFVLESFALYDGNKLLVDCYIDEQSRVILPYHNIVYTLMEQEADSLLYHCKKSHFEKCKVKAYNLSGKCIKGQLEVPLISLRASTDIEVFNSNLEDNHG